MLTIEPPPFCQHAGQEGLDHPEHAAHVEIEGEPPLLVGGVEHRAVMDEARAIEQHIGCSRSFASEPIAALSRTSSGSVRRPRTLASACELAASIVGRPDTRALARERARCGRADPCPAAVTTHVLPLSLILPPLLDQALFLVEPFRAGMQRDAQPAGRCLQPDGAALAVAESRSLRLLGFHNAAVIR
jgi:hypothetical protein